MSEVAYVSKARIDARLARFASPITRRTAAGVLSRPRSHPQTVQS